MPAGTSERAVPLSAFPWKVLALPFQDRLNSTLLFCGMPLRRTLGRLASPFSCRKDSASCGERTFTAPLLATNRSHLHNLHYYTQLPHRSLISSLFELEPPLFLFLIIIFNTSPLGRWEGQ